MSADQQDLDQHAAESGWLAQPQQPPVQPKKRHRLAWTIALVALPVASIGLVACGGESAQTATPSSRPSVTAPTKTQIQMALENFGLTSYLKDVGDNGHSITLSTGLGEHAAYMDDVTTLLNTLKIPDAVTSHIEMTRALDGVQTDSWGNFSAQWTYHPDDGLNITIKEK